MNFPRGGDSSSGGGNTPSPRKELQLQGPCPAALKVNKESHKIRKPPIAPPQPHYKDKDKEISVVYATELVVFLRTYNIDHLYPESYLFSMEDMPYIRKRTAVEIFNLKFDTGFVAPLEAHDELSLSQKREYGARR